MGGLAEVEGAAGFFDLAAGFVWRFFVPGY
jgi:hypothetical protein